MRRILVLQHIHCETPGLIADSLQARGGQLHVIRSDEGQPVPAAMGDAAALVVMGGPMGVYEQERYPFLRDEIRLLQDALAASKPILGVCLGSQLLAAALGAPVMPGPRKEIGWHRVSLTADAASDRVFGGVAGSFAALHWHGDVFELPRGAVSLASSALTRHQAFRYGANAYGILFHMELTGAMLEQWVTSFADELRAAAVSGGDILGKAREHLPALHAIGRGVFDRWASLVPS